MDTVDLAVTRPVLEQLAAGNEAQRMIALRSPSPTLAAPLFQASGEHPLTLTLAGQLALEIRDRGGIWAVHQAAGDQRESFDLLFALLAARPDTTFTFVVTG